MNTCSFPVKGLFELIDVVQCATDEQLISKKITDSYQKIFGGEQSLYFAPDDESGGFTDAIKNNIDEKLNRDYKEYYYQFDPLNLMSTNEDEGLNVEIVRNIDYEPCRKSEYYNDFLSPQHIHFKLLAIFKSQQKILGKILLLRSRKSGNFTKTALRDAESITPYLANALENNRLKHELERHNGLLQLVENNLKTGIILLDKSQRVIHANDRAREICGLRGRTIDGIKNVRDIHPNFIRDFYEMMEEYNSLKNDGLLLPRTRVIRDDSGTFSVQSKLVHDRTDLAYPDFFMINIDEMDKNSEVAREEQCKEFKLSEREKEVADQVVRGLHNSEIADNLYISEVTVKKHLQNIFQKTGVDNRAALVHTLLTT